ncbi:hypothetical protein IscW_ISCW001401 [Ixodes scapularis]|uniref:Uncharacterized protein n=1 Tax=Ixodes scapularis TaxID=6945 RepID=B7P0K1_IXOSC|nr:hypothetical protein IscW_ISCW001401 [Ixodes scapularis]|eukprot:XP_002399192.1 hypothetical protein IscW_ISCW001401 [Ixodes scapularis]
MRRPVSSKPLLCRKYSRPAKMKLSLPLSLLAFSGLAFGAIIEKVEDRDTNRVNEEGA